MNRITLIIALNLSVFLATQPLFSQGCYEISRTKDKEIGWETYHGAVKSYGWHVSAARQFYRKDAIPSNYYLLLYNPRLRIINKNKIFTFGKMRIHLEDNSILHLDSVRYENDPLKDGGGFSAKVYLVDEEIQKLKQYGILRIYVDDLDIPLEGNKRKKISTIINCLVKQE
jgi:hypothetical protein